MSWFKIEATYGEDDGAPVVDLEFARHDGEDADAAWAVCGKRTLTDPAVMTPKRVREASLAWLAEHAGMRPDDSFELHSWVRADRELLEEIASASAS